MDSYGRHLHNVVEQESRQIEDWFNYSISIKNRYRFSICSENSVFPGYTSEKIVSSLLAHSVPIYFGNPNVINEFNQETFIFANSMTDDELIDSVIEIDNDQTLWANMVTQPWRLDWQIEREKELDNNFRLFCNRIFEQDLCDAKRTYQGTSQWQYRDFFKRL